MELRKAVTTFERPQGTIKRIKCWAEGEDVADPTDDNCYLVEQDGRHVLIDTCRSLCRDLVLEELDRTGVDAVALTHGHFDHCQNTAAVVARYGSKVAMSARDIPLMAAQTLQPFKADTDMGRAFKEIAWSELLKQTVEPFDVDYCYHDWMPLTEIGLDGVVFATPGHTKGHVGIDLWGTDVFVGDILMNIAGAPVRALLFFDGSLIDESVHRILALEGERTIHFGHGDEVLKSHLFL